MESQIDIYVSQIKSEGDIFNKAKLIKFITAEKGIRIVDLSKKLNIKPSYICHILRLNLLPELIIDGYYSKLISLSHLFIISRIKDKKKLMEVYEKIITHNLTIIQTEVLVRETIYGIKTVGNYITGAELDNLRARLKQENEIITLKIVQSRIKSKMIFEISGSLEKTTAVFKRLIDKITFKPA